MKKSSKKQTKSGGKSGKQFDLGSSTKTGTGSGIGERRMDASAKLQQRRGNRDESSHGTFTAGRKNPVNEKLTALDAIRIVEA